MSDEYEFDLKSVPDGQGSYRVYRLPREVKSGRDGKSRLVGSGISW